MSRFLSALALAGVLLAAPQGKRSTVHVQILGNGQEIAGATVRLKAEPAYDQEKSSNSHGLTTFKGVPRGGITVQVTAAGWNTFGEQFQIDVKDKTLPVTLTKHQQ